jgi:hypothetical protein
VINGWLFGSHQPELAVNHDRLSIPLNALINYH